MNDSEIIAVTRALFAEWKTMRKALHWESHKCLGRPAPRAKPRHREGVFVKPE